MELGNPQIGYATYYDANMTDKIYVCQKYDRRAGHSYQNRCPKVISHSKVVFLKGKTLRGKMTAAPI